MSDIDFALNSFKKYQDNLVKAKNMYPNIAEDKLEDVALKFKNRVIALTKETVKTDTDNLINGFKLETIQRNGVNIDIQFISSDPEFQKIENGYNQVLENGRVGWVPGKQIVKQAIEEYQDIMENEMNALADELIRGCGLT